MTIDPEPLIASPLPRDRSVGIGCIGAGFIMRDCHLVAYRQAGLNPVGIVSRTRSNAEEVASVRSIPRVHDSIAELTADPEVEVLDIAVPPDHQQSVIESVLESPGTVKGILAQKPLGMDLAEAREIVSRCEAAGIRLAVNQNMRFDQSVRLANHLIDSGQLGDPVLATIDMRAIPHWMPWQQRLGWVTLRIMSIHHLDTMRYWFGDPVRIFASVRPDPRTSRQFTHTDGICLWVLEYASGLRVTGCDDVWTGPAREGAAEEIGIGYRIEGDRGLAIGTIGWPSYPERTPSTLRYSTIESNSQWHEPTWESVWFPDAFAGPMGELLLSIEENRECTLSGRDNLRTMALVEAAYRSAEEHRTVELAEFLSEGSDDRSRLL